MYSFIPTVELLFYDIFDFPHWNSFKGDLPVAPDTIRKMQKGVEVSERSKKKVSEFYSKATNEDPENFYNYWSKGGYLPQGQLKGYIGGLRLSSSELRESFFLDQVEKMLNQDVQVGYLCNEESNELNRHEIFWQSDLARKLCSPMGLQDMPPIEQHNAFKAYGGFSLILYFIAAYEVSLKEQYSIDCNESNSLVDSLLPNVPGLSISWPIKNVTKFWQQKFNISSVEKLADLIPISGDVDIEHKKRRLEFWRSGEKNPDIDQESTLVWLKGICRDSSVVYEEYVRFHLATILQRLAKLMYPELFPPEINSNVIEFEAVSKKQKMKNVEKLFQIYKHHYQSNMVDFQEPK